MLLVTLVFQSVSASYNTGDDMDIFIDNLGNKNMVWRELVNGTYQVFYRYDIVETIYDQHTVSYYNQTINHNLVFDDGYLTIQNCHINGNIKSTRAQVAIENCEINGNINHKLGSLIIESSEINGNVDAENSDLELRTSCVNGNVKTKTNTDKSYSTIVTGNDINGNVDLKSGICYVVGNTINGNLKVKEPAIIQEVSDNVVSGNTMLTDNTSGFDGYRITKSPLDAMYPQVAIDSASGMGYALWVIYSNDTLEFWYTISPDMIYWLEPHHAGILNYTAGNPELDMEATNGTLYVTWKECGELTIAPDYNAPPELQVLGVSADGPVVHLNEPTTITLNIGNSGNGSALYTVVNITDIVGDNETLIDTTEIGILKPGLENVYEFSWTPVKTGIHYLKIEMQGFYITHHSPAELIAGLPVIMSAGISVSPMAEEWVNWAPGKTIHNGEKYYLPSPGKSSTQINVTMGNLIIEYGGLLQLNDSVTLVIENLLAAPHAYGINIESGGKFVVNSLLRTTQIQTPSSFPQRTFTYPFLNSGVVDFLGANVLYTYGPSNLALAGGIQNKPNSVCNLTNCRVEFADTHSITANNSDMRFDGSGTLVGKGNNNPPFPKGSGITVVGNSNVVIDGITVDCNEGYGIKCVDTENRTIIENNATVRNGMSDGIYLQNSDATITNVKIHDNSGDGIVCVAGSAPQLTGNNVSWNGGNGIRVDGSLPKIKGSTSISRNGGHGILAQNIPGSGLKIENNIVKDNMGSGIWCDKVNATIANNTVSANGQGLMFSYDVESDPIGWSNSSSLWHRVNNESGVAPAWNISHSGDWAWWCGYQHGIPLTGDYNDTTKPYNVLSPDMINLTDVTSASLVFWSWYESGDSNDWREIQVSTGIISRTFILSGDQQGNWVRHVLDISSFAGRNAFLYFIFHSDLIDNEYRGWYIDDIQVISSYPAIEGYGIYCGNQPGVTITNNIFLPLGGEYLFHEAGIHLVNASVIVQGNTFDGIGGIAIWCTGGSNAHIESNIIVNGNRTGIYCNWSSPTIIGNTIIGNSGWGILSEYAAPANSGNDTAALLAANPNLGTNGLGKCIQYWALRVKLTDSMGLPIANGLINVRPLMGAVVASNYTDANGFVTFTIAQDYADNNGLIPVLNPYLIDYQGQFYPVWVYIISNQVVDFQT